MRVREQGERKKVLSLTDEVDADCRDERSMARSIKFVAFVGDDAGGEAANGRSSTMWSYKCEVII